ncbi:MAG: hypothetical protein IJZ16_09235 [Clostridia bacterium]|nr:hypothetical protein [Clostridia bacterium]
MYQASTPTDIFTVNDISLIKDVTVTYLQNRKIVIEKTLKDLKVSGNSILHELTQEETLSFSHLAKVRIELLFLTNENKVIPKVFDNIPVEEIINKKVYNV